MPADTTAPRIIGTGYAVPTSIRGNDDPVFDWLKKNNPSFLKLFTGYEQRRYLTPNESIDDLLTGAAEVALDDAGLKASDIDMICGYSSVSHFVTPNNLYAVHRDLGLAPSAWVWPVQGEFTNFMSGVLLADRTLRAGAAKNVLIVCGCN